MFNTREIMFDGHETTNTNFDHSETEGQSDDSYQFPEDKDFIFPDNVFDQKNDRRQDIDGRARYLILHSQLGVEDPVISIDKMIDFYLEHKDDKRFTSAAKNDFIYQLLSLVDVVDIKELPESAREIPELRKRIVEGRAANIREIRNRK